MKKKLIQSNSLADSMLNNPEALNVLISNNRERTFDDKLRMLLLLGKKSGYNKLTSKQITIAYYGKYTTKNNKDCKTLSEIKTGLSNIKSEVCKNLIEFDD